MTGPQAFVRRGLRVAQVWGPAADRATRMVAAESRVYAGTGTWTIPLDLADDVFAFCQAERLLIIEAKR